MQLTEQEASLVQKLIELISKKWGINIGFTCPAGSFVKDDDDFIIVASGNIDEEWDHALVHRLDFERESHGILCREKASEFPCHDDECQELLNRVNEALLSGELYFNPSVTTVIDGMKYDIEKTPDGDYRVWTDDSVCGVKHGFTSSFKKLLEEIELDATRDERCLRSDGKTYEEVFKELYPTRAEGMLKYARREEASRREVARLIRETWGES